MIVLWGLTGDGPFDAVAAALRRRDAPCVLIDQRRVLETRVARNGSDGDETTVTVGDETFRLDAARAVYWRTYDLAKVPAVLDAPPHAQAAKCASEVEQALVIWLDMADALVFNRPSAMASNNSKPYQMQLIRELGFEVPHTLITTDPDAAARFWTESGAAIYKSISGTRSVVSTLRMRDLARLSNVAWCPTQFQQYVPGSDYRVHVVGDAVFPCEIVSEADDYRYAALHGDAPVLRAATLPAGLAERCVHLSRKLDLPLAGIDLRRTPDDRWYCFEVNPSPGFTYYEAHTGQPIADTIAACLADAAREHA